jgi:TonB family protein
MKLPACLALFLVSAVGATAADQPAVAPTPAEVLVVDGREIPVYDAKQVRPIREPVGPEYPPKERKKRVSGHALLLAVVDLDGRVEKVIVKDTAGSDAFGPAAAKAVKKWRYPKLTHKGQPTTYVVKQTMVFQLAD